LGPGGRRPAGFKAEGFDDDKAALAVFIVRFLQREPGEEAEDIAASEAHPSKTAHARRRTDVELCSSKLFSALAVSLAPGALVTRDARRLSIMKEKHP
jgi:hypothetical protein